MAVSKDSAVGREVSTAAGSRASPAGGRALTVGRREASLVVAVRSAGPQPRQPVAGVHAAVVERLLVAADPVAVAARLPVVAGVHAAAAEVTARRCC